MENESEFFETVGFQTAILEHTCCGNLQGCLSRSFFYIFFTLSGKIREGSICVLPNHHPKINPNWCHTIALCDQGRGTVVGVEEHHPAC